MTKKNKIIIAVVSIFFIIAIALTIFFSRDKKEVVDLYKVEEQDPITFTGSAQASSNQDIYLDSTKGEIIDYYVKNDEEVVVGQKLFIYENETIKDTVDELTRSYNNLYGSYKDVQSQVSSAKGELSSANKKIEDITSKINNISETPSMDMDPSKIGATSGTGELTKLQGDLQKAQAEAQAAQATITQGEASSKELKAQYEEIDAKIASTKKNMNYVEKATVGGIVKLNKEAAKAGVSMTGGEPVISITSKDIVIKGKVTEYDYEKIKLEDRVDIEIANSGKKIGGTITYIDSLPISSDSQIALSQQSGGSSVSSYSFDVKPDEVIHYGFSVNIKLPQEDIFIPEEAVEKSSGKYYVYTVENGKTVKKEIQVQQDDGVYKLENGLKVGDKIVANVEGIKEGMEVETNTPEDKKKENIDPTDTTNMDSSDATNISETTNSTKPEN
ncbi:efflux RND transporter periplasmic adaptor subunit [Miniphocaeibacter massiliensis]|uniref:efflux RND transporter periplasmic adaptor subunit n=1 Tax=Miniphocaeibacter massiliensis TaxID=2041841 RepID=UPI000C07BB5B|nr:efflux RND transporter periplasmic adaptor subunit [Miniphocaeibacter massiliensis]